MQKSIYKIIDPSSRCEYLFSINLLYITENIFKLFHYTQYQQNICLLLKSISKLLCLQKGAYYASIKIFVSLSNSLIRLTNIFTI
jgi:hypothetical protein